MDISSDKLWGFARDGLNIVKNRKLVKETESLLIPSYIHTHTHTHTHTHA